MDAFTHSRPSHRLWEHEDVVADILKHLPAPALLQAASVCRLWSQLAGRDSIWQLKVMELLSQHAPTPSIPSPSRPSPHLPPSHSLNRSSPPHLSSALPNQLGQPSCDVTMRQCQGRDDVNGGSPRFSCATTSQIGSPSPYSLCHDTAYHTPSCSLQCPSVCCDAHSQGHHLLKQCQELARLSPYQPHDVSRVLPLSVSGGKWRAVFKELMQLDRDWKFPPLLPVSGAGCSSAEDGWGVEYTTSDDFFWFSKPFHPSSPSHEWLDYHLSLPLCLVAGVELVPGGGHWNACTPHTLQIEVGFTDCPLRYLSPEYPIFDAPTSQIFRLPPSALALGTRIRLHLRRAAAPATTLAGAQALAEKQSSVPLLLPSALAGVLRLAAGSASGSESGSPRADAAAAAADAHARMMAGDEAMLLSGYHIERDAEAGRGEEMEVELPALSLVEDRCSSISSRGSVVSQNEGRVCIWEATDAGRRAMRWGNEVHTDSDEDDEDCRSSVGDSNEDLGGDMEMEDSLREEGHVVAGGRGGLREMDEIRARGLGDMLLPYMSADRPSYQQQQQQQRQQQHAGEEAEMVEEADETRFCVERVRVLGVAVGTMASTPALEESLTAFALQQQEFRRVAVGELGFKPCSHTIDDLLLKMMVKTAEMIGGRYEE